MYHVLGMESRVKNSQSTLFVAITMSLFVTVLQQFGVMSQIVVDWMEPLGSIMKALQLLNFDLGILRVGCVAAIAPESSYSLRLVAVICFLSSVCLVHVAVVVIRYKGKFAGHFPPLIGGLG